MSASCFPQWSVRCCEIWPGRRPTILPALFHGLGDQISLTGEDRRRALNLDDQAWTAWTDFLSDGPLPAEPPLPEMLRRLGETAYALSMVAEERGVTA
jgi:hypothetical protein